jgi:large subunit ribosomal protein L24
MAAGTSVKMPEIRKGDTVVVLSGKDVGKRGKVEKVLRNPMASTHVESSKGGKGRTRRNSFWRAASPHAAAVVVEGLNIAKRHTKPRQSQNTNDRTPKITQGGILDLAQPMSISKVMLVCTHCDKPTRIAHKTLDNGRRVRVCRHCGEQVEVRQ